MNETVEIANTYGDKFKDLMLNWGLNETWAGYIVDFSALIILLIISIIVYYITKYIINRVLKQLVLRSASKWDDHFYKEKVFTRLGLLIPPFFIKVGVPLALSSYPLASKYIQLGLSIYISLILILVVISFLNAIGKGYQELEVSDAKPIKGYLQFAKIIVIVLGAIVTISIILGESPVSLLVGLGTMSAVLMFIFRDPILGFIAGIQLSSNKSIQIGDWIAAPKFNADGTVIDIALVTVKVRNFDNSVSLLPTYSLISDSFINWRSFGEAGGRRMKRSFLVDVRTIEAIGEGFKEDLRAKGFDVDSWFPTETGLTNLGLFRRYLAHYLHQQQVINREATLMIRLLQPTENGLPVEVYAFFSSAEWVPFENFQADFFEHIYDTLPDFGLKAFQRISNVLPDLGPIIPAEGAPAFPESPPIKK
ncbi:MAG: mechanosensitive ion channel family protein [Bacteroidales bacterium]|nr:mechanosensitive ion channel family protein [Bacteroidales bacterium]